MAYNYWTREIVTLKEGEDLCSECKGYGMVMEAVLFEKHQACIKCGGHGKLDWVEKAVGNKTLAVGVIEF